MESISSLVRNLAGRSFHYCSGNTLPTIKTQNTTVHPAIDREDREWLVFYQFEENAYEHSNLDYVKLLAVSLEAAVALVANALRGAPVDQGMASVDIPAILLDFPSTSNNLWLQYVPPKPEDEQDRSYVYLELTVPKEKDPIISDASVYTTFCARGYHRGVSGTHTFGEMTAELDTLCRLLETNHPLRLAVS